MATAKKCNTAAGAATLGLKIESVPKTACVVCKHFDPRLVVKKGDMNTGCKKEGCAGRYIWAESECDKFRAAVGYAPNEDRVHAHACVRCKHFNPQKSTDGNYAEACEKGRYGKYIWCDSCCSDWVGQDPAKKEVTLPKYKAVAQTACVRCKHFDPSKIRKDNMNECDGCQKTAMHQDIWTASACDKFEAHHTPKSVCAVGGIHIDLPIGQCGNVDMIKKCSGCDKLKLFTYEADVRSSHMPGMIYTQIFVCGDNGDAPLRASFQSKCKHINPKPTWMTKTEDRAWGQVGGCIGIRGDSCTKSCLTTAGCMKGDKPCKFLTIGTMGGSSGDRFRLRCGLSEPTGDETANLEKRNCGGAYYKAA